MPDVSSVEPWLRGPLPGEHPVISHLLRASQQIREEAAQALSPLTVAQIWATPFGMTSAGFHAKHLAGSTRRLSAYLEGRQLSAAELEHGTKEGEGTQSADELIAEITSAFTASNSLMSTLTPTDFASLRYVGRQKLPVTAISLAIHIAEHGQRHVGQLISAAKLAAVQCRDAHAPAASEAQSSPKT